MTPEELAVLRRWLTRMTGQSPAAESRLIKAMIERFEVASPDRTTVSTWQEAVHISL